MKKTNRFSSLFPGCILRCFLLIFIAGSVFITAQAQSSDSVNNSFQKCNSLFMGPSTIFEDNTPRFNTFGANATFTHPVTPLLGITGDAGVHFGSSNGTKYTKLQLLGGISLLPRSNQNNKIFFSPYLLAGITNVKSKFTEGTTFTSSSTNFSMAAGTNVVFPINNKISWGLKGEINPTFIPANIKWNIGLGGGIYIKFGCNSTTEKPRATTITKEKPECAASLITKELKISFTAIEKTDKAVEEIANKIPRVEAKINVKPQLTVKQGEECCYKDQPPVPYTELKGGVDGSFEININLWGIPDINYSLKLWPVLLVAEFKCKLFAGPTGKIGVEGVGKFYGDLGNSTSYQPNCLSCWYLNFKAEGFLRIGVKAGGSINIYHWSPFNDGGAGFDVTGEPDEKVEASAEASVSLGNSFNGTYRSAKDCVKPPEGIHGKLAIGKAKANLKFNLTLGPISFDPSFEFNLFDGIEVSF